MVQIKLLEKGTLFDRIRLIKKNINANRIEGFECVVK